MAKPEIKYFISYAHNDKAFFDVFKKGIVTQLRTSGKYNFISWDDSEIPAGSYWHSEIQKKLGEAKLAILCVSADFLNSGYIQENELKVLRDKFPDTTLIPVYFNHCHFNSAEGLSQIQFFKPNGNNYGETGSDDFAFCDMVDFTKDGVPNPNSNIDRYLLDLSKKIENGLGDDDPPPPPPPPPPLGIADRIVEYAIVLFIAVAGIFSLRSLLLSSGTVYITTAAFFGGIGIHFLNKILKRKGLA